MERQDSCLQGRLAGRTEALADGTRCCAAEGCAELRLGSLTLWVRPDSVLENLMVARWLEQDEGVCELAPVRKSASLW